MIFACILFDLTLATPEENLALDEALLEDAEAAGPREALRLWESPEPLVVLGRSSQARARGESGLLPTSKAFACCVAASGGAAIVAAPGSLMYAVVLSYELRPALRSLDEAHRFVLETTLAALRPLVPGIARQGTSDLTLGRLKFSGNSVRCKRRHFLYHGTLLYDFDAALVDRCLAMPPRQPEYRENRAHSSFVANLPIERQRVTRRP